MSKTDPQEIPHGLGLVIDYVNTLDLEAGSDALLTPAGLRNWLSDARLLDAPRQHIGGLDRAAAIKLREALRALMLANNGGRADDRSWTALELAARRGDLGVHFERGGAVDLLPGADGIAGALARLLAPVAASIADGSWQRVKACPGDDCSWAFYDRSRNRSAVWCEMAVCGNRTKVRAYRERAAPRRRQR